MPIYPISSLGFPGLITDLGLQLTPRSPLWFVSDTVQPVALVNTQVPINANLLDLPRTMTSNGEQIAQGAGTILADTGQLLEGNNSFRFWISYRTPVQENKILIQWRNAANTANIVEFKLPTLIGESNWQELNPFSITMKTDERMRVIFEFGSAALETFSAVIFFRREE